MLLSDDVNYTFVLSRVVTEYFVFIAWIQQLGFGL